MYSSFTSDSYTNLKMIKYLLFQMIHDQSFCYLEVKNG